MAVTGAGTNSNRNRIDIDELNYWLGKTKAKFKKGDKVICEVKFGDSVRIQLLKGKVDGIYRNFLTVNFDRGFRQSYTWHDVYSGKAKHS